MVSSYSHYICHGYHRDPYFEKLRLNVWGSGAGWRAFSRFQELSGGLFQVGKHPSEPGNML